MWKTILRRVLIMIPQLILLSVLVFMLSKMMPGDPLTGNFSQGQSAAQMAALRQQYGLNDPWYIQYFKWVGNMFHGDLGQSFVYKRSVTGLIGERAVNTFWLALMSTVILYVIAIPAGVIAGRYEGTKRDSAISVGSFILMAVPPFVFYLLGLIFFGFFLQWFPTGGSVSSTYNPGTLGYVWDRIYHMILPALVAGIITTPSTIQYLRTGVIDNTRQDFVRTARSKGVPDRVIFNKHILRNSLLPIAAFMGNQITMLLGGSVILETVFSYPGMGQLFVSSMTSCDYPVVISLVLLFGFLTLLGNLLSDIIMSIVDPRIRIE